ncbi:MAG: alkaline phosphatase PhoX [Verrucomicrobiales bacterium]
MRSKLVLTAALIGSQAAMAGSDTWFTPLTESATVVGPNDLEELTSPWVTPADISQKNIISLREVEDTVLSPLQSIIRVNAGTSSSMFDMLAYDPTGEYLFIPHETPFGAGVTRYSVYDNASEVIFQGDQGGADNDWSNDFGAFDPCRFTPNGTLFLAEEWAGMGRVLEVLNPFDPVEEIQTRVLDSIANVSHEGINFSKKFDDTIYFVDENHSGSIYKFVMATPGDYTVGQTFVLSVDAFTGNSAENYSTDDVRTGEATWIPLTDEVGNTLPGLTDPFVDDLNNPGDRPGRTAADEAGGTPYGRPEDMAISRLKNGREVLYFTATSEATVYSVEILEKRGGWYWNRGWRWRGKTASDKAIVRTFVNDDSPKNLGFDGTTATLNSPDNLALDALGNIYVIEDAPNGSATGGDVWFARDTNNDGVAESLDHFMSIRVDGSEATGMIWNPEIPTEFAICVQHPDSTNLSNVPDGLGDSVWLFNVTPIENEKFVKSLNKAKPVFGE